MTKDLTFLIIKETVTSNVVWMLDPRGAGMADLSYLEQSAESDYRLQTTFQASKTLYRLLMFLNLFRRTARPPRKVYSAGLRRGFRGSRRPSERHDGALDR